MANLSVDKHCEMLTAHIRDRVTGIMDGFKLFVQLFSAVVGGTVILHLQYPQMVRSFTPLADALTGLILVTGIGIMLENIRSWYEFRIRLSNVAGEDQSGTRIIPDSILWRAMMAEWIMIPTGSRTKGTSCSSSSDIRPGILTNGVLQFAASFLYNSATSKSDTKAFRRCWRDGLNGGWSAPNCAANRCKPVSSISGNISLPPV